MSLTKSEEEVMKYLWKLEKAFFRELKDQFPEPKPATTTINTVLKRLIEKKYIDYRLYGNSREYYPLVSRNHYFANHVNGLIKNYFNDSVEQFGSFFTRELDISNKDLSKLKDIIDQQLKEESDD